jgi:hypothetical protein
LSVVPLAYALLTQHGVKTTRLYEPYPSEPRVKLNASGIGILGGIDPPTVAYQQVVRGNSNIKFYNADTHARSNPPAGVNTSEWEWEPSISGDWLLDGRLSTSSSD